MKALRITAGSVIGLFVGTVLGFLAVGWQVRRDSPPLRPGEGVGIDIFYLLRDPVFWVVLLLSAFVFAYLFSRIGHSRRAAQV